MKKVLIAGASGMIGQLILDQCLLSDQILEVTSLVRKKSGRSHSKLNELQITDFTDYSEQQNSFTNIDIAFFCIGVYTGQVPDNTFKEITVDYAVAFANALKENSPKATLCFLSGAGADRKEKSRMSFAKYKGIAENRLSDLGLGAFYSFRPSYIFPVTTRKEPNITYRISRTLYPIIKVFGKNSSIKSTELASAMFNVGLNGADQEVLENRDILNYSTF